MEWNNRQNWSRFLDVSDVYLWFSFFYYMWYIHVSVVQSWLSPFKHMVPLIKVCLKSELEARTHLFFNQVYSTRQVTLFKNKKDCVYHFLYTYHIYKHLHVHVMFWTIHSSAQNSFQLKFVGQLMVSLFVCSKISGLLFFFLGSHKFSPRSGLAHTIHVITRGY